MNEIWQEIGANPEEVLSVLSGRKMEFERVVQWLKYIDMYRAQFGPDSYSISQTAENLVEVVKLLSALRRTKIYTNLKSDTGTESLIQAIEDILRSINVRDINLRTGD